MVCLRGQEWKDLQKNDVSPKIRNGDAQILPIHPWLCTYDMRLVRPGFDGEHFQRSVQRKILESKKRISMCILVCSCSNVTRAIAVYTFQ